MLTRHQMCLPASQHLTGPGSEVLIQSCYAVLQSHEPSLETWLRIQLHLKHIYKQNLVTQRQQAARMLEEK